MEAGGDKVRRYEVVGKRVGMRTTNGDGMEAVVVGRIKVGVAW